MAVTREQVTELYVADFNRAPDSDGVDYWVASGLTIEQISESFFDQAETQAMYPDTMTDSVFVNTIYKNVFNRDADADGLVYWEEELANGSVTRANMILAIVNGAQNSDAGQDQTILDNKTEVGLYFADAGLNDVTQATDVMSDVDATDQSVAVAKGEIDGEAPITNFNLIVGADTITGTDGDDTIIGAYNGTTAGTTDTYQTEDTINGGAGDDTLKLSLTLATPAETAVMSNVENAIIAPTATAQAVDTIHWSGVEDYTINMAGLTTAGDTVGITNIRDEFKSVTVSDTTLTTNVITLAKEASSTMFKGDDDSIDVILTKTAAVATDVNLVLPDLIENYNIKSTANVSGAGLKLTADTKIKTMTITGESDLTLETSAGSIVSSIDASALTAALDYTVTNVVAGETVTIKGGSGANDIDAELTHKTNTTYEGGVGIDTFDGNDANDTISTGKGADIISTGDGTNIVNGGEDRDVITLTANKGTDKMVFNYTADSGLSGTTADKISNFQSGTDKLTFTGLEGGNSSNFVQVTLTGPTSVETAVAAVNNAELKGFTYLYDTTSKSLIVDADGDGYADTALDMDTLASMVATDII